MQVQLSFSDLLEDAEPPELCSRDLEAELLAFREYATQTAVRSTTARGESGMALRIPTYVSEFWTSQQRVAHSLHEVSYRACFKPQFPRFFI